MYTTHNLFWTTIGNAIRRNISYSGISYTLPPVAVIQNTKRQVTTSNKNEMLRVGFTLEK